LVLAVRREVSGSAFQKADDVIECLNRLRFEYLDGMVEVASVALLQNVECCKVFPANGLEGYRGVPERHPNVSVPEQLHDANEVHPSV
jgi:hypothetical protein